MALVYYVYITFLGYNCESNPRYKTLNRWLIDVFITRHMAGIAFLKNTRLILAPLTLIALLYIVTLIIGWNVTQTFMNFYHYRVL